MRNKKGMVIFLVIVLSTLLLIGAGAVYSLVTGRFSITRHLNNKIQAMRDAEAALYVAHQMIIEGNWKTGTGDKKIRLKTPDGMKVKRVITIDLNDDKVDGYQPIKARVKY